MATSVEKKESEGSTAAAAGESFLRGICEEYAADGDGVVVDLSLAEQAALGRFLLQAVFGFYLGLKRERQESPLSVVTPLSRSAETENSQTSR